MTTVNFAHEVYVRSTCGSLIDATTGKTFPASHMARVASYLHASGLQKGDFLVVSSGVDPESALVYLGAVYAGIVPVLVADIDLERHLAGILTATGAKVVWTKSQATCRVSTPPDVRVIGGLPIEKIAPIEPAATKAGDLAVLMPTSGSTGVPKLVQVTHENLLANSWAIIKSQQLTSEDRALLILPVHYCFGASVLHTHLLAGGDVVFERRMMFPDKMLDSIDRHSCTTFAGVPTVFRSLLRWPRFVSQPPTALRKIFQAGGKLEQSSLDRIRKILPATQLFVMYGQTEATARITTLDPNDFISHPDSVGKPLDDVEIQIVSEQHGASHRCIDSAPNGARRESIVRATGNECPCGEVGEIWVRGRSVTSGYWGDPEGTRTKFADGWLKTGDLGSIDGNGYLNIAGRLDSFVKIRGLRVALGEVEAIAQQIPEIQEAAACGIPHEQFGEAVALFLVLAPEASLTTARANLRKSLPPQWSIDRVYAVDDLPKTSSNKINRPRLEQMALRAA